jgi:hypothetical protein
MPRWRARANPLISSALGAAARPAPAGFRRLVENARTVNSRRNKPRRPLVHRHRDPVEAYSVKTLVLAATAAAALLATSASAAVSISFDGSTSVFSQAGDGVFDFTAVCGVAGANCGGFETVTLTGSAPLTLPGLLHSDNVGVNAPDSGPATLTIWVTRTGVTSLGDHFFSSFTSNNQGGPISVHLETLISSSNQLFGGVNLASFDDNSVGSSSQNFNNFFDTSPGVYSVTEKYVLTAVASGAERSASPTITLATAAVPEPASWALMIAGFGGAGAMLRRRREHRVHA